MIVTGIVGLIRDLFYAPLAESAWFAEKGIKVLWQGDKSILFDIKRALPGQGIVCVVAVDSLESNQQGVDVAVSVIITELETINRPRPNHATCLEAAAKVAESLDSPARKWRSISHETGDAGVFQATVNFSWTGWIESAPQPSPEE